MKPDSVASPDWRERVYRREFDWEEINQKPVLTREESAFFLRVSLRSLDDRLGVSIPFTKFGARVLIRKAALLSYLETNERKPIKQKRQPAKKGAAK